MQDIERLCERIVIIDLGKIIFDGTLTDLTKKYVKNKKVEIVLSAKNKINCSLVHRYGHVISCEPGKALFEVPREKVAETTSQLIKDFDILDLEISEMPIEEIIADIFKENKDKAK